MAVDLRRDLAPMIALREPIIPNRQEFGVGAYVPVTINERFGLLFCIDPVIQFSGLGTLPYPMLIEELAQVLWANANGRKRYTNGRCSGHAQPSSDRPSSHSRARRENGH